MQAKPNALTSEAKGMFNVESLNLRPFKKK